MKSHRLTIITGIILVVLVASILTSLWRRSDQDTRGKAPVPAVTTNAPAPVLPSREGGGQGPRDTGPASWSPREPAPVPVPSVASPAPVATAAVARAAVREAIPMRGDDPVIRIDGRLLRARDIIVYGKSSGNSVQEFSPEEFDAAVERAVRRELTFKKADELGLELTDTQRAQLEQVRETVRRREGGDENAIFLTVKGSVEEQIAFELREAEAMLLQNTLMEQAGLGQAFVTQEETVQYYQSHTSEFPPLPEDPELQGAAWLEIENQIRGKLAMEKAAKYEKDREAYFEDLKSKSRIEMETGM